MLRNPFYQYGPRDTQLPANVNFGEFILDKLLEFKERTIINGLTDETITYGHIAQQSMNLAISLSHLGVRKGQTVAICSENRAEFWSAVVGSICTGASFSTFNMMYTKDELAHVAGISKPQYIICSPLAFKMLAETFKSLKFVEKIIVFGGERVPGIVSFKDLVSVQVKLEDFQPVDVQPDDTLCVLYSSGTTGLPKGVMLTHRNVIMSSCSKIPETGRGVCLSVTPLFHAMGLMTTFLYIAGGKTIVYLRKFEVEAYLRCIEKYKVNRLSVVPPMLRALLMYKGSRKFDLRSVDMIYCGAAPFENENTEAVKIMYSHEPGLLSPLPSFPNAHKIHQAYGMSETTLAITRDLSDSDSKQGSVGTVVSGTVIKVIDLTTSKPVGANQPGEIRVKGGTVMKGYVGRDRKGDFDDEGYFKTGDIGYYDQDGYFFIVDRVKELIKYKGYQVAPAEIEAVLLQHSEVRDAGVIGVPDLNAGEVPRAFVVLHPGASTTQAELQKFIAERLSNAKHLRGGVCFVSEIPKTASGKILRRQLRALTHGKSRL